MVPSRLLPMALALVWLVGCAAQKAYKEGMDLQAAGKLPAAAAKYLDALDSKPTHPEALVALAGVAEEAWKAKLAQAADAEGRNDYTTARDKYQELARLQERLDQHGFLDFPVTVDALAKAKEMEEGAAERAYLLAEKQRGSGQYENAIAGYREAQGFVPGFRDTQARIASAYIEWGTAEAAAGRWRSATQKYQDGAAAGAVEGTTRSAEVYLALGRWNVTNGACRQAVRDLKEADRLVPGSVRADLAQASSCAETRVAVVVDRASSRDVAVTGYDPTPRLDAAIAERIPGATSDFVVVVDDHALQGPPKDDKGRLAVDRIVGARALRWDVVAVPRTTTERRTTAEADATCVDPNTQARTTCTHSFEMVYTEVTEARLASLSVTANIVTFTDSKILASRTFDLGARGDVTWVENLRDATTGESTWPTRSGATAVRIPAHVQEMLDAPRTVTADSVLFTEVTDDTADAVAAWAATTLDAETTLTDPTTLKIQPLPGLPAAPR